MFSSSRLAGLLLVGRVVAPTARRHKQHSRTMVTCESGGPVELRELASAEEVEGRLDEAGVLGVGV